MSDAENETYGHTKKEWQMLPLKLMSAVMIVMAIVFAGQCPAIPTLIAYCATFGVVQVATSLVKFIFNTERPANKGSNPGKVAMAGDLIGVAVAIWGAAIIYPKLGDFSTLSDQAEAGEGGCANGAMIMAIISCSIPLAVIAGLIVFGIPYMLYKNKTEGAASTPPTTTQDDAVKVEVGQ